MVVNGKNFVKIADKITELEKQLSEAQTELENFKDAFKDMLWHKISAKTIYLRESGVAVEANIANKEIFVREMGSYTPELYSGKLNGFKFVMRLRPTDLAETVAKIIKDAIYELTLDWDER